MLIKVLSGSRRQTKDCSPFFTETTTSTRRSCRPMLHLSQHSEVKNLKVFTKIKQLLMIFFLFYFILFFWFVSHSDIRLVVGWTNTIKQNLILWRFLGDVWWWWWLGLFFFSLCIITPTTALGPILSQNLLFSLKLVQINLIFNNTSSIQKPFSRLKRILQIKPLPPRLLCECSEWTKSIWGLYLMYLISGSQ